MQETDLYGDITKSTKAEDFLLHKIADGSVGKKPGDYLGIDSRHGLGVILEVKAPSRPMEATSVDWTLFETHQIGWLRAYAFSGGLALVAIYDKSARVLYGWSMNGPNDKCDRSPDVIFKRSGDHRFTGWRALVVNRLVVLGLSGQ